MSEYKTFSDFRGKPLIQATEQKLDNDWMVKRENVLIRFKYVFSPFLFEELWHIEHTTSETG